MNILTHSPFNVSLWMFTVFVLSLMHCVLHLYTNLVRCAHFSSNISDINKTKQKKHACVFNKACWATVYHKSLNSATF